MALSGRRAAWLVVVAAVAAFPAAALADPPEKVVATPRADFQPAVTDGFLAYSQDVYKHPSWTNLYVKPDGAKRFKANPAKTDAVSGGIDGTTLVYSQRTRPSGKGDIKLYDLVARTRSNPPAGVNTTRHETGPSLSGDWLAFLRSRQASFSSPRRLLLRNLTTAEERELDFGNDAWVQSGEVAGNYVAWTRCPRWNRCTTWLHDIAAETTTKLPNPQAKSQFAVTATDDGTVYYAESGTILCSKRKTVRFWRQPLAGPRELLATLPRGKDTGSTSALVHDDGSVDLYFDRANATCTNSDIYRVRIPAPAP